MPAMGIVLDYSTRGPSWVRRHWRKLAALLLLALVATPIWWYWRPIERWARWQWTYRRVVAELRVETDPYAAPVDRTRANELIAQWCDRDPGVSKLCTEIERASNSCKADPNRVVFAGLMKSESGTSYYVVLTDYVDQLDQIGRGTEPIAFDMPNLTVSGVAPWRSRSVWGYGADEMITPVKAVQKDERTIEVAYGINDWYGPKAHSEPIVTVRWTLNNDRSMTPVITWSDRRYDPKLAKR
jgi:hypothetical protein